jgi:hypothetical protein
MNGECESAKVRECESGPASARKPAVCTPGFSMHTPRIVILRERTRGAGARVDTLRATEGSSLGRLESGLRQVNGGRGAGRRG